MKSVTRKDCESCEKKESCPVGLVFAISRKCRGVTIDEGVCTNDLRGTYEELQNKGRGKTLIVTREQCGICEKKTCPAGDVGALFEVFAYWHKAMVPARYCPSAASPPALPPQTSAVL